MNGLGDLIDSVTNIVSKDLIPIAFALCLLYFFWGVAMYIRVFSGSEKAAEEGKRIMFYGVIALFIVSSIWGIIGFIRTELDIPGQQQLINK